MLVAALSLALAAVQATALPADIFERDRAIGATPGITRSIADLLLGRPDAARKLETALAAGHGSSDQRLEAYQRLCGFYFREQRFADGVRICSAAEGIEKGSAGNMIDLHRAYLAGAGPAKWSSGSVRIPLRNGQLAIAQGGSGSIVVLIDTGAELGVISRSAATALQARPVGSPLQIGTTTTPIDGELVQVESIAIGNAQLRHLIALVIPDEQAAIMGAQLVIPLSALTTLGRMAYLDHGRMLVLGDAVPRLGASRSPLYWDESGVGFAVRFAGGVRGVHFDSGSERTWLFPAAGSALSPAERGTRQSIKRKIAGLGGERTEDASVYRNVAVTVAGRRWQFPNIEMAEKDENGEAARAGIQLFERFRTVVLDFRRMQMSVSN